MSLRTTHASWVFLTDHEAWKVKRPVDYGFLDYSDPVKRRRSCEEEVRLGARLAPDVYTGVVPVYLSGSGHSFVGPGTIVDHAVRMRRLADDESALALMAANRLLPSHLHRLAESLAEFYARVPQTPAFGSPAILSANVRENFEQTRLYFDRFMDGRVAESLFHWQQGVLFAHEWLLQERSGLGRVRDGHGDLRLEHIYFPQASGPAIVIDPIEFNPRFRCADVAMDVAFFAMELDANERPDLGAYFLARFARETDDYGFYPVADLYLSYRAWVRAKVACFVAADASTPPEKAERKAAEAARFMALAEGYSRPRAHIPHVIAVGGGIGTGKSTVADALSLRMGLPVVSSDVIRKRLAGLHPTERGGDELYVEHHTRRTYEEMVQRAQSVLDSGRGVILDATFPTASLREMARALAREHQRPFLFVQMTCDPPTVRQRLAARAGKPSESDAREEHLGATWSAFEPPSELSRAEHLVLDGAVAADQLADQVRRAITW